MTSRGDHLPGAGWLSAALGCSKRRAAAAPRDRSRSADRRRNPPTGLCDNGANSLDLLEVQEIVGRAVGIRDQVGHALFAAFRVDADALEVGSARATDQAKIAAAKRREVGERFSDIRVGVIETMGRDPGRSRSGYGRSCASTSRMRQPARDRRPPGGGPRAGSTTCPAPHAATIPRRTDARRSRARHPVFAAARPSDRACRADPGSPRCRPVPRRAIGMRNW